MRADMDKKEVKNQGYSANIKLKHLSPIPGRSQGQGQSRIRTQTQTRMNGTFSAIAGPLVLCLGFMCCITDRPPLTGKVMRSVVYVRPLDSNLSFELTDS